MRMCFERDSLKLFNVEVFGSKNSHNSHFTQLLLVRECCALASAFIYIVFFFICTNDNCHTDFLAKNATSLANCVLIKEGPLSISAFVISDVMALVSISS